MLSWKKIGRIFDPRDVTDRPWLHEFAQAPSVIIFEKFVRVYFSCRPLPDSSKQYVSYSAYVDLDRQNLHKIIGIARQPIMSLGERGTFDEFGTYPVSVIKNGDKLMAYYGGWTRCESVPFNVAIGAAVSHDNGIAFKKLGPGPVLSYTIDEPFILSGPKIRQFNEQWYLFYIAGKKWLENGGKPEPVYKIRMAISNDGVNWKKQNTEIIESRLENDEPQASPDVFYYNNKYHMFFCYRYSIGFRGKERGYRIGYAFSQDLVNWTRDDAKSGLDISKEGWDDEMVSYPHVFELDDKVYMLYLGNQVGRYGFGLAELQNKAEL